MCQAEIYFWRTEPSLLTWLRPRGDTESQLETSLPTPRPRRSAIRDATKEDAKSHNAIQLILTGWPKNNRDITEDIKYCFAFENELIFQESTVFRGEGAVVPGSFRANLTYQTHSSCPTVHSCLGHIPESLCWQGMNENLRFLFLNVTFTVDPKQQIRVTMILHIHPAPCWDLFSSAETGW